jgi:hypothetical protein
MSFPTLYAFWESECFPYLDGGPVKSMDEYGKIQILGNEQWYEPIKILPIKAGQELHRRLHTLHHAKIDSLAQFHREWENKVKDIIPFVRK